MKNNNTYYTEQEIKYYSQIAISALLKYDEEYSEIIKEREQGFMDKIGKLQAR
jgi:hypothetical protein